MRNSRAGKAFVVCGDGRADRSPAMANRRGGRSGRPRMAAKVFAALALTVAAALILPNVVFAQGGLPSWVDDNRRQLAYPTSEWFVGFSVGTVQRNDNIANVLKRVENEARGNLAAGITVNIQATTTTHTAVNQARTAQGMDETIRRRYGQVVETSANAEVGMVEVVSYHDKDNNRIYALARVKKADLAAYYVSRIEYYLQIAENEFKMARQFAESERKRSALERIEEAKKNIEESGKYKDLLSVVDFRGDIKRMLDRSTALDSEIAAFVMNLQDFAPPIFVTGNEAINGGDVSVIIPALQNGLSEGGCRITDNREEAGYTLTVDVTNCQMSSDANFTYCYACVKADLVNVRTGRSEARINFTGPKTGWTNADRACRTAFGEAAKAMLREIREKTEICR